MRALYTERSYRVWLRRARVPAVTVFAVVITAAISLIARDVRPFATPIAYGILTTAVAMRSGRSLRAPLVGALPLWQTILLTISGSGIIVLAQFLFPARSCFFQACGTASAQGTLTLLIFVLLLAPVAETIVMQGWFQTRIAEVLGPGIAFGLTAAVFVGIHLGVSFALVVAACVMSWLRVSSRSLASIIVVHAVANLGIFLLSR